MKMNVIKYLSYMQEQEKKWILSKITAIFINIVFMYMTAAIICFMSGKRKINFNSELFEKYFGTDYFIQNNENKFLYILVFFAAPIIASFAISMVQIAFSLAVKNMAGFIISMIIYIISIFDINIFLPGNGCMAQRSSLFMENGLSVSQVIIIYIIIIVITFVNPVENNQCKGYIIVIKNYSLHFCIAKTGRWE